jgi:hypothetical protein
MEMENVSEVETEVDRESNVFIVGVKGDQRDGEI